MATLLERLTRTRSYHVCICLGAVLAVAGCQRVLSAMTSRPKAPRPLEAKMEAALFSLPSAKYPLPYRLFKPKALEGKKVPLIVSLHATPGRGDDNTSQLAPDLEVLVSDRVQSSGPAYVLAPQCPDGDKWANRNAKFPLRPYDLSSNAESDASRLTVALVRELIARYPTIDADRVYLIGFSMGGSGAWDMLMRHSDVFAAGVPITGVADVSRARLLASMPIWSFHGELDEVSPVQNGRRMFDALRQVGAPARYTEFKGVGHGSIGPALDQPELFSWLFAQRRAVKTSRVGSTASAAGAKPG